MSSASRTGLRAWPPRFGTAASSRLSTRNDWCGRRWPSDSPPRPFGRCCAWPAGAPVTWTASPWRPGTTTSPASAAHGTAGSRASATVPCAAVSSPPPPSSAPPREPGWASVASTATSASRSSSTLVGGGDGASSQVYEVVGGKFRRLNEVSSYDSLGNYYAYVTAVCGFKAQKHEGKITGLAAHGVPKYLDVLDELITSRDAQIVTAARLLFQGGLRGIRPRLPPDYRRED